MAFAACGDVSPTTHTATRYAARAKQDGESLCTDVGAQRVCWRGSQPTLLARTLPSGAVPPDGWRCGGSGRERVCEARTRNASAFVCGTQRCLQTRPRMPDDGEWECVEMSGVVFCHSRGVAAGVSAGPMDLGWLCGARRGSADGERICVDLDADRPELRTANHCRFEQRHGAAQRSCTSGTTLLVGSACQSASACPTGSRCTAGLCLPQRPEPACWFDRDCGEAAQCLWGSCTSKDA